MNNENKARIIVNDSEARYIPVKEGLNIEDILTFERMRTPEENFRKIRVTYMGRTLESEEQFRNPCKNEKIRVSSYIRNLN